MYGTSFANGKTPYNIRILSPIRRSRNPDPTFIIPDVKKMLNI